MVKDIKKFLNQKGLLLVVFITGACVLVLEVVATRILSPYFGNTIFNYSSVIGIVLAALSLGYYFGGKYADTHPTLRRFYQIILLSGLATLLVKIMMTFMLPTLGYFFPITIGPVITSILLFTLPCFLMGTLSPYAIKLQEVKFQKKGIGNLSGEVFFASTLGSIFGTFLAGFYLIPTFGIGDIVIGVGVVLFVLGFLGAYPSVKIGKKVLWVIVAFSITLSLALVNGYYTNDLVYVKDGYYEKIGVINTDFKGTPARILIQDRSYSSGISIDNPDLLLFDYSRFIDLYKVVNPNLKNALFIGGGAYSMPKYLIKNLSDINVDVAEIEPELYPVAIKYFGVKKDPRLHNYTEDGRRFLYDSKKSYDLIFSDVYSSIYSIPSHFTTREFFELGKSRLAENGIFLVNIISDLAKLKPSLLYSEMRTFSDVFKNTYFFAVDSPTQSGAQNIILVAFNTNKKLDFAKIAEEHPDNNLFQNLSAHLIDLSKINLSDYPMMTDDYSPTEYLTSKLFI